MVGWNLAMVTLLSFIVVNHVAAILSDKQILKTSIERDIQEIKSTTNIVNSLVLDITNVMSKLDSTFTTGPSEYFLKTLGKRTKYVINSALSDLTQTLGQLNGKFDNGNIQIQMFQENLEKIQVKNKQVLKPKSELLFDKPFDQQYDTHTLNKIYQGEWAEDELSCYTDEDNVIKDNPVRWNTTGRAFMTLPPELRLAKSTIPNAGTGIFTDVFIPEGTYFGPYDGYVIHDVDEGYNEGEYVFNIYKNGEIIFYRDAGSVDTSNWTRFINCPRDFMEVNVEAQQCKEEVYFCTIRDIKPGSELFFFYGWEYAESSFDMKQEYFCKGYNGTIFDSINWICE